MPELGPGPDPDVLRQKLQFVRENLRHLRELRAGSREEFLEDWKAQAAATRGLQVGIEAMLDAANHIIAREGLGLPKTYQEAIDLLQRDGILPRDKENDFASMVRFRNRAVHLYDDIDPEEIWSILQDHLGDFEDFVGAITRRYF